MYCPKCRSEYQDDVRLCAECGVSLVDALTDDPVGDPNIELVEVWRAHGEIDAQMTRSILEAAGVEAMLSGESVRLTHGITIDGLAEVKILVRAADEVRAREALSASDHARDCPQCGAHNPAEITVCRFCGGKME